MILKVGVRERWPRFVDVGATARLLLVTSGDQGSNDPQATLESVAATREAEARQAAQELGVARVAFLQYPDGHVENTQALRHDLVEWVRRWQPQYYSHMTPSIHYHLIFRIATIGW